MEQGKGRPGPCPEAGRPSRVRGGFAAGNLEGVSSWLAFIAAVLGSGKTSQLGLLVHMYSGPLDSRFELAGREVVRATQVTGEFLGHMKEDVLYVFRP